MFIREKSGLYRREQELHDQRGYEIDTVRQTLVHPESNGVSAMDADDTGARSDKTAVNESSHGQKKGKKNKIENRKDDRNV